MVLIANPMGRILVRGKRSWEYSQDSLPPYLQLAVRMPACLHVAIPYVFNIHSHMEMKQHTWHMSAFGCIYAVGLYATCLVHMWS